MRRITNTFPYYSALLLMVYAVSNSYAALPLIQSDMAGVEARDHANLLFVSCSPERPTMPPGGVVKLKAWASTSEKPSTIPLNYVWAVSSGHVRNKTAETRWDLKDAKPGHYWATVRVTSARTEATECSVQIVVESYEKDSLEKERRGVFSRETGRSFLLPEQREHTGYGLYSYLILGGPPSGNSRERYLKTIEAYLSLLPDVVRLEKHFAPSELNITYLPVDAAVPRASNIKLLSEWVLDHYDYARARSLLRQLGGNNRDGPYVVSVSAPLSENKLLSSYLWQDFSAMPPQFAGTWVKEFMNQAAQEHFWETRSLPQLRLKIRAAIAVLSMALPDIQNSLDSYIKMGQPASP